MKDSYHWCTFCVLGAPRTPWRCLDAPHNQGLQGGTRLLWGPGGKADTSLKTEGLRSNKTTGKLSICFISCAAECPDIIYTLYKAVTNIIQKSN
jgi:hypothetical protein